MITLRPYQSECVAALFRYFERSDGTTALACAIEGRRCITSEMDPVTFAKARARLARGFTPGLFQAPRVKMKQGSLV